MRTYIIQFQVNSKTLKMTVTANSPSDAKKSVQMQYAGQRVTIVNCKDTTTGYYC